MVSTGSTDVTDAETTNRPCTALNGGQIKCSLIVQIITIAALFMQFPLLRISQGLVAALVILMLPLAYLACHCSV